MTEPKKISVVFKEVMVPFVIITSLFALWRFITDMETVGSFASVNISFFLPCFCFFAIAIYGYRTWKVHTWR